MGQIADQIENIKQQIKDLDAAESIRTSTAKRFTVDGYYTGTRKLLENQLDALSKIADLPPKNIEPNTLNQIGQSIEPVTTQITTQIKKPENQGLLLIAGLVVAAIVLK